MAQPEPIRHQHLDQNAARDQLWAAMRTAQLTLDELWIAYLDAGGEMSRSALSATVLGSRYLSPREYRFVAVALSDQLVRSSRQHGR